MKGAIRFCLLAAAALLRLAPECHGFLSNNKGIQWHCHSLQPIKSCISSLIKSTNNDNSIESISSAVFQDEFASLIKSHPLDDPEPSLPERQRQQSPNAITKIPTSPEKEWEWFYSRLRQRHSSQGESSTLTSNIMEESLLRHWMAQQRKAFMKTLGVLDLSDRANWGTPYLSRQQKELLDQVDFPWGHLQPSSLTNDIVYSREFQQRVRLDYKDWLWNGYYERLSSFVQEHGHSRVSVDGDDGELARWTAEQRKLRRKMPERRRQRLDELQFDWNWKDNASSSEDLSISDSEICQEQPQKVSFGRRVKELKEYRTTNGDCNVPLDYPGGLGEWVQRMRGRRSKLSPSSIVKLETIGLVFTDDTEED